MEMPNANESAHVERQQGGRITRRELWEMVQREDSDIVLLQEVTGIPGWLRNRYQCHLMSPRYFGGHNAPFSSAVLAKGAIDATPYLESELEWVNKIYAERYGWIVGCEITLGSGKRFRGVTVHSPAFPIPRDQWADVDVSDIKLTNNPDLWFTEILWVLLRAASISDDTNWIVGGDFNSSVKFDEPKDRGNREIIGRLNALGLTDCLSHFRDGAMPTFQDWRKTVEHQLDYCYVNAPMLERLTQARVPSHENVFGRKPRLSDHLPILCEFDAGHGEIKHERLGTGGRGVSFTGAAGAEVNFFDEVTPRLEEARKVDRLGTRFNVLKYLCTGEQGLSRMIADLLDPAAEHGQDITFLRAMLDTLPKTRGQFQALRSTVANPITVQTERATTKGGRIDITVDIPIGDKSFCLAFENKPYAPDLVGQVRAYLEYLGEQYEQRFLLVYLPPDNRHPDETSLPQADLECWHQHFAVMPYAGKDSLAEWFETCCERCAARRVRTFLHDAATFCRRKFGGETMPDRVTRTVQEYLSDHPAHLRTALAVHDAWRHVRAEVCERFLHHLRDVIDERLHAEMADLVAPDLRVRCRYGGDKRYSNDLWITYDSWALWDGKGHDVRTFVRLCSEKPGPNGWIWGISNPKPPGEMNDMEQERRGLLERALDRRGLKLERRPGIWWPQYETLPRYADWNSLVPDLYEESEAGGGPITTYIADGLLNIARLAIPAIDDIENTTHIRGD